MRVLMCVLLMSLATGAMAQDPTIPTAFQGDWSTSLKGCNDPYEDTNGLTVTASSLSLYDGVGIVEAVEEASASKIKVAAFWNAEGDTYRDTHELNLSDNGNKLSMTGLGKTGTANFIRCPA
jgi:hypothetical protein